MMRITVPANSHLGIALEALLRVGWRPVYAPEGARVLRNGQLLKLRSGGDENLVRLFTYKVTGSGRSRPHEKRIEITSTYQKGLAPVSGYKDTVLGYDEENDVLVGVDPRRIRHGGPTGNASSFIQAEGILQAQSDDFVVLPRASNLFGVEHQAYFRPWKLSEYLFNSDAIHRGEYDGQGEFSANRPISGVIALEVPEANVGGPDLELSAPSAGSKKARLRRAAYDAFERGDANRLKNLSISPEEYLALYRHQMEIGVRGEQFVLAKERTRLRRLGLVDLATQISWVAKLRPFEGYDILSFESDGTERYIEVKATTGHKKVFPITANEWTEAGRKGDRYFIYRVTDVYGESAIRLLQNPVRLQEEGRLNLNPLIWRIEYE